MTRYKFALLTGIVGVGMLGFAAARGQDFGLPPAPRPDDLEAQVLEEVPADSSDSGRLRLPDDVSSAESIMTPDPLEDRGYGDRGEACDPAYDLWGHRPALTESSGTWLRRGWWYTEIEGVVLNRMWKRDDLFLAGDTTSTRSLQVNRTDPGAAGSARFTLGRFLFRDYCNRDHTLEFTAFGGGEWSQDDTLTSSTGGQTLILPQGIDDFNQSFDNSNAMAVTYDSQFTSMELNYRVKGRMRRDRMELMPGGEWVRRATEGITKHYLVGLRYFDLNDTLDWRASNIQSFGGADGRYLIDTDNDMFGLQIGCSLLMEHDRWNIETFGKGGVFLNDVQANSAFTVENDPDESYTVLNRNNTMSFVGELQVIGRYHLRPHLSLRAGWQMMYVSGVALAPDQITFSPDAGVFPYTGDPFYNGGLFGFEAYW